MFGKHVTRNLSAYAHGELSADDARRVSDHMLKCERCRRGFEEIKLGVRLAESLPRRAAPPALWDKIEGALPAKGRTRHGERPLRSPGSGLPWLAFLSGWQRFVAAGLVIAFVTAAGAVWFSTRPARSSWEVARLAGAPLVASERIRSTGRLAIGEWLETDGASRARVKVAEIGQVEIDPNSRVRLLETRLTEHRLELARGRISANIWAPPRLFFVNTPSAIAADLGCAYTLEVDERGRSLLHVTSGWVALELKGRESIVPAGATCVTEPETGPGTPFFDDAPGHFITALARFDFEGGGAEALRAVLESARPRDTLTLWHLLPRVDGEDRARVYERLASLAPPPEGVTRQGVIALDREMLGLWKDQLESRWLQESLPAVRKTWRKLWQ